jgi:hypothetical protein
MQGRSRACLADPDRITGLGRRRRERSVQPISGGHHKGWVRRKKTVNSKYISHDRRVIVPPCRTRFCTIKLKDAADRLFLAPSLQFRSELISLGIAPGPSSSTPLLPLHHIRTIAELLSTSLIVTPVALHFEPRFTNLSNFSTVVNTRP